MRRRNNVISLAKKERKRVFQDVLSVCSMFLSFIMKILHDTCQFFQEFLETFLVELQIIMIVI